MLVVAFGFTYKVWRHARATAQQEAQAYFDFRSRDALRRLAARLGTYEEVLRGARGLFSASQTVRRGAFATFVASLNVAEHHPGIQGVGYAVLVPRAQRGAHVAAIRREGFPGYTLWPAGERDPLTAIIYLEPFSGRNLRAFGYDMFSEAVRREAMTRAWQTGATAMSGRVLLVQETGEDVQAGFLMYLPIYRNGPAPGEGGGQRRDLVGWVYAPFRMYDFMAGVLGEQGADLDIEIHDGDRPGPGTLMYDRKSQPRSLPSGREMSARYPWTFGGLRWTVDVWAQPGLEARLRPDNSSQVLVVGALGSVLAALLVWALALGRDRALALAETRKLQVEAQRLHHQGAIGILARGLAHDFNNLLQSILSWVSLARLSAEPGGKVAQALDRVEEGSAQARDLAERLHILGDIRDPMDTEGPVAPLLREAVLEALAGSQVEARFDLASDAVVRFHASHLRLAIRHVAANAREAMEGQGLLTVSMGRQVFSSGEEPVPVPGAYLHMALADTGPGMDPEILPLIFDPYFSTKQTFSRKGLGLGLALCRIIVQHHGGAVSAESRRGAGTTVHLYLPIAPGSRGTGQS